MGSNRDIRFSRVCSNCVGESYLSEEIVVTGKRRRCFYCQCLGKTISIVELADRIHDVVQQFYQRTSIDPNEYQYALLKDKESNYEFFRDGDPITTVIEELALVTEELARDLQSELASRYFSRHSMEIGEETEFSEDSHYEYVGINSDGWEHKWERFGNSLRTESRYFNGFGKEYLDSIFDGILNLDSGISGAVVEVGPGKEIEFVFRSRVFLTDDELEGALENIVKGLGPPPPSFAKAGRMNAAGVSVFYGSTDAQTSLAEVRPPVGSSVAIARFRVVRNLKLLNLIGLRNFGISGSYFDPEYANMLSRVWFLNQLCEKMTVPVMPGFEETDYIITQAISDYLSTELDGILFPSIQTTSGSNLVLFRKSSRVAERVVPIGTDTFVSLWNYDEDGKYRAYEVREFINGSSSETMAQSERDADDRVVSIVLDEASVEIHEVKSVAFTTTTNQVSFRREVKQDFDDAGKSIFGSR